MAIVSAKDIRRTRVGEPGRKPSRPSFAFFHFFSFFFCSSALCRFPYLETRRKGTYSAIPAQFDIPARHTQHRRKPPSIWRPSHLTLLHRRSATGRHDRTTGDDRRQPRPRPDWTIASGQRRTRAFSPSSHLDSRLFRVRVLRATAESFCAAAPRVPAGCLGAACAPPSCHSYCPSRVVDTGLGPSRPPRRRHPQFHDVAFAQPVSCARRRLVQSRS